MCKKNITATEVRERWHQEAIRMMKAREKLIEPMIDKLMELLNGRS